MNTVASQSIAREFHLASRPEGMPGPDNFRLVETPLPRPAAGQVLVENLYLSVDPYMRGRMRAEGGYAEPYQVGEVMYGGAIGRVAESRNPELKAGTLVLSNCGWRDRFLSDGSGLTPVTPWKPEDDSALSAYLGVLGMPGLTAWVGLLDFGQPKAGETVFVSAASGAVGATVCQIAKLRGCRVIGSVGSEDKAAWLKKTGVDAVINYRQTRDLSASLAEAAPGGVDVYFENVGGEHLRAAIANMNPFGRIAACGMISGYNQARPEPGPDNLMQIVGKRLRITGFIISDHRERRPAFLAEMEPWLRDGRIIYRETVSQGLESAVDAFLGLFSGRNFGKMIIKI